MQLFVASTAFNGRIVSQSVFVTDSKEKLINIIKENQDYEDVKFDWYWEIESLILDKVWDFSKTSMEEDEQMIEETKHTVKGYISKTGEILKEEPDYLTTI